MLRQKLSNGEKRMLRIGFPKGNLLEKSLSTIANLLDIETEKGKLHFSNGENYQVFLLKHRDIPFLLQQGKLDFAIVSTEWLEEKGSGLPILCDLGWSKYKICLIGHPSHMIDMVTGPQSCVTEYPVLAERYIQKMGWKNTKLSIVSGSSEGLVPAIYECCIDCVETGMTLKKHGLAVFDTLFETGVVLVGKDLTRKPDTRLWNAIKGV